MSTLKLPRELGTPKQLRVRFDAAKARKLPWVSHLQECYEYALPQRESFTSHSPGAKKNTELFDSTAVIATHKFASRLQSTIVPPWQRWSKLVPGSDHPKEIADKPEIQEQLDHATETLFTHLNHSNFATQVHEAFLDLAVGTCALTLEEGDNESVLEFNAVPLSELVLEEGPHGTIETVWREHKVAARNIERMWPGAKLSKATSEKAKKQPDERIELVYGCVYEPKAGKYYGVLIECAGDEAHLAWMDVYDVSPWIVGRWFTVPGEIYGRGPIMSVLPDIKTANKVVEFVLRNAALAITGAYTAISDGVINPFTVRIAPGVVIPVASNDNANPSLRALERTGDFNVSELVLGDLRENIKRALFNSMRTADGPVKSATEIAIDNRELVADIGSSFGRIQTEIVERVIKRATYILQRRGKMPRVKVDGRDVSLKHMSPLARAQDQEDLVSYSQFMELTAPLGQQIVGMSVKIEDIPGFIAQKLGIDHKLLRDEAQKKQVMQMMAQYMAQMQAQEGGAVPGMEAAQ